MSGNSAERKTVSQDSPLIGQDILARAPVGAVNRNKILRRMRGLDPESPLFKSLRKLEQDLLRQSYEEQMRNIISKLTRSRIVPLKEIKAFKAEGKNDDLISPSHKARMEAELRQLGLLLKNDPLKNSRQRRREQERLKSEL